MNDELLVIAWIFGLIAAVLVGGFLWQRRSLAAARRGDRVSVSLLGGLRLGVVLLVGMVAGPVATMVPATSLPAAERTLGVLLLALTAALAAPIVLVLVLRPLLYVGRLELDDQQVTLRVRGRSVTIDRTRPFELFEGKTSQGALTLRVVGLRQGDRELCFSYPVPAIPLPVLDIDDDRLREVGDTGIRFGVEASEVHRRLTDGNH